MSMWKRILDEIAPRNADPVAWAARHPKVVREYARRKYGLCPHLHILGTWCMDCNRRVGCRVADKPRRVF